MYLIHGLTEAVDFQSRDVYYASPTEGQSIGGGIMLSAMSEWK